MTYTLGSFSFRSRCRNGSGKHRKYEDVVRKALVIQLAVIKQPLEEKVIVMVTPCSWA